MPAPAVNALMNTLRTYGPQILRENYFEGSGKNKVELSRLQSPPGPQKANNDIHATGRALDIILFSTRAKPGAEREQEVADRLVQIFLELRTEMRWSGLIYNRREWNSQGIEQPPRIMTEERRRAILAKREKEAEQKGRPGEFSKVIDAVGFEHLTHIHIDWSEDNAPTTTFTVRLNAAVSNLAYELDLARPATTP